MDFCVQLIVLEQRLRLSHLLHILLHDHSFCEIHIHIQGGILLRSTGRWYSWVHARSVSYQRRTVYLVMQSVSMCLRGCFKLSRKHFNSKYCLSLKQADKLWSRILLYYLTVLVFSALPKDLQEAAMSYHETLQGLVIYFNTTQFAFMSLLQKIVQYNFL